MGKISKIILGFLIGNLSGSIIAGIIRVLFGLIGFEIGGEAESFRDIVFLIITTGIPTVLGLYLGIKDEPLRKMLLLPVAAGAAATSAFMLIDLLIAIFTGIDLGSVLVSLFMIALIGGPATYMVVVIWDN